MAERYHGDQMTEYMVQKQTVCLLLHVLKHLLV